MEKVESAMMYVAYNIHTQHMRYYPFAHAPLIYYTYTEYLYHKQ